MGNCCSKQQQDNDTLQKQTQMIPQDKIDRIDNQTPFVQPRQSQIIRQPPQDQTSYSLGQIGQQLVIDLLKKHFDSVLDQSATGHYGDILVEFNNLKIMFEIKNKQNLTKQDFLKFEEDAKKFDYSIFISLNSTDLFQCKDNKIYIYGSYLNDQTIEILKQILQKPVTEEEKDIFYQQQKIVQEKWKISLQKITEYMTQLQQSVKQSQTLENSILGEINVYQKYLIRDKGLSDEVKKDQESQLRSYLNSLKKAEIRKKNILQLFPDLDLQTLTLQQIIDTYRDK